MKNLYLILSICVLFGSSSYGQAKTFEIIPDFSENGVELISSNIELVASKVASEFVGLSCYHFDNEAVDISYRLRINNQWAEWISFEEQHEFVASSRKAYSTKPLKESFSEIQFRLNKKLANALTVRFFFPTLEEAPQIPFVKSANCDLPEICNRSCWCPTCPIDVTPEFTAPTHLVVHHSAGNNESNNFASVVEFIWDLHVNTNGWDDIGYNWLIDPNGAIYQGRPDGYQGAHFSCINENTVGVCMIGDYTFVQPTDLAISSLVDLLAYEAIEHGIDVNGQSYHLTGDFILDNVAGHRDSSGSSNACSSTVCPGNSFYPMLEEIRIRISDLPCYQGASTTTENILQDIDVFPNPFSDYLAISSSHPTIQTLEIFDLYGKVVGVVNTGKSNDLSHLKAGVYFLRQGNSQIKKIIKR